MTTPEFVLLDIEASSLSDASYPIEVGWCVVGGDGLLSGPESHLIIPHPAWLDWDPASQAIHGISRAVLFEEGRPGPDVARRLFDADVTDGGRRPILVTSDFDRFWLNRLYKTCDAKLKREAWKITIRDFRQTLATQRFPWLLRLTGVDGQEAWAQAHQQINRWQLAAEAIHPHTHRAGADARSMAETWILCMSATPGQPKEESRQSELP